MDMGRLIIVAGASGAGKSFLLENARRLDRTVVPVKKFTTRDPRTYEDEDTQSFLDLKFSRSIDVVTECDYKYPYGREWYGLDREHIDEVLAKGGNPIIIIRNCETILDIKRDYTDALVVYLQGALSGADLRAKLAQQGRDDIEIDKRMDRLQKDFHDYVRHLRYNIFGYVLVNTYERDSLIEQLQMVLEAEIKSKSPTDPNFIFVLMSFRRDMDEAYEALKTAGQLVGRGELRVERVDAQPGGYRITDKILSNIETAALIICDLTHERPNVYYELGYARGLNKRIINCAHEDTELHFDIKDFRTIFYSSPTELQRKMRGELAHQFRFLITKDAHGGERLPRPPG